MDLWGVFKSRARHLQEAQVQRSHQWDNQEWSRERDVTQRQVLQVIVSAQGAARRDCRFQAEHVEHGKIRTQCEGCSACDRQSGKTRRWRKDDRPSQCGSCFVVVALLLLCLLSLNFGPMWLAAPAPFAPPSPLFLLPSSLPSHPQGLQSCSPQQFGIHLTFPEVQNTCVCTISAFIRKLIWCSHLINFNCFNVP